MSKGFLPEDGQTMVLIGDSITDCDRQEEPPLGRGYVRLFTEIVTAAYPERNLRFINRGIGGNTITDLRARWQEDVLDIAPDWISIILTALALMKRIVAPSR